MTLTEKQNGDELRPQFVLELSARVKAEAIKEVEISECLGKKRGEIDNNTHQEESIDVQMAVAVDLEVVSVENEEEDKEDPVD